MNFIKDVYLGLSSFFDSIKDSAVQIIMILFCIIFVICIFLVIFLL